MFSNIKIFLKSIINDNSLNERSNNISDEYSDLYEKSYRSRIEFDETQESLYNLLQKEYNSNSEESINSERSNSNSEESINSERSNSNSEESINNSDHYINNLEDYKINSEESINKFNMISYAYSENSDSNYSNYNSNSNRSINSDYINNFIENESHLYDNNEIDYSKNKKFNIFKKLYKKIKSKINNKTKKTGNNDNQIKASYDISELVNYTNNYN